MYTKCEICARVCPLGLAALLGRRGGYWKQDVVVAVAIVIAAAKGAIVLQQLCGTNESLVRTSR